MNGIVLLQAAKVRVPINNKNKLQKAKDGRYVVEGEGEGEEEEGNTAHRSW